MLLQFQSLRKLSPASLIVYVRKFSSVSNESVLESGFFGLLKVSGAGNINIKDTDAFSDNPGRIQIGSTSDHVRTRRRPLYWSVYSPVQDYGLAIDVPIKFNLDIISTCAAFSEITVANLENESINIKSDATPNDTFMEVTMKNTKSNTVFSKSNNLKFACLKSVIQQLSTISANLEFFSDRIIGENINLDADRSRIDIQSLYCKTFFTRAVDSHITIGSAHGILDILVSGTGSVNIGSLEGSLTLKLCYGDVKLHLSKPQSVQVDIAEGDLTVSLPASTEDSSSESSECSLDATGSYITVDEEFNLPDKVFPQSASSCRLVSSIKVPVESHSSCVFKVVKGKVQINHQNFSNVFSVKATLP